MPTLRGLSASFVIVLLTLAGLVPLLAATYASSKSTRCINNLAQLWKMQYNYAVQFGGQEKLMSAETGDAFWLQLSRTDPPLIDATLKDIYQCPVEGVRDEGCDYRGPIADVNRFRDEDPVGADVDGNHGVDEGGNVLRRSGDCFSAKAEDPLWAEAAWKTTGGNAAHPPFVTRERRDSWFVFLLWTAGLIAVVMMPLKFWRDRIRRRIIATPESPEVSYRVERE